MSNTGLFAPSSLLEDETTIRFPGWNTQDSTGPVIQLRGEPQAKSVPTEIKGIMRNPRIFGGKPIIGQHRISVHDIAAQIQQGYTPEQIVSEEVYPTLTLAEVYAALHYYYEHKEEIDREIAEETAELK